MQHNISEELLSARLRAAGCVFAEDEARLLLGQAADLSATAGEPETLERMVQQRCAGLPLEQVLGWAEFYGLRIPVAPGVFVPRRRTELLAGHSIELLRNLRYPVFVELCCGSGAVSVAVAAHIEPVLEAYAVDIQSAAVACAGMNLEGQASVFQGDLFSALPSDLRGRIDVVAANAPYVPTAKLETMPPEARDHEPAMTLDGGSDGLDVLRRIIASVADWLGPDGSVLVECSRRQAGAVQQLMSAQDLWPEILCREDPEATIAVGRHTLGKAAPAI